MRYAFALATAATLTSVVSARDVPANLKALVDSITSQGSCKNALSGNFYSEEGDAEDTVYCGDHLADDNIIYLQGTGGKLTNMDIDCDGIENGPGDDGRCHFGDDNGNQSETSFGYMIADYSDQKELNAFVHTYAVLGNVGDNSDGSSNVPGYTVYQPQTAGIQPLSLMAVVCGDNQDRLFYGIWGDENGDDGPPLVGEASISLATLCCDDSVNADQGCGDNNDFLFIAFAGDDAVPGASANWDAQNANDFEASLAALGDKLVANIGGGNGTTPPPTSTTSSAPSTSSTPPSQSCAWPGHCQGTSCSSDDDCSDPWSCVSGTCN